LKGIPTDIELVERLQNGDIEAFDLLYEKYSGVIYSFSFKYLKSTEEAEDLVQSVFLKIWGNHKNLKKESSFKSYLFTIVYNDICKLYRKRTYHQKFVETILYESSLSSMQTEDSINSQSVLERVLQIIDKLPERQKSIFLKSRKEGKSTKEIAEEVGLSPGTIDNYISDSLKFIRTCSTKENLTVLLFLLISLF
jgi:RNA polymerase sigma-70 factor (ECF subfamily)